jgi:hypothetical protein
MLSQIMPLSIVRYRTFAHHHVPNAGLIFVDIIYLSNGLFNVILFSVTRPFLLPHSLPSSEIELASPSVARPPGIENLNGGTDIEVPAVHLESPVNENFFWQEPDPNSSGILQWSAEGMAYVTSSQSLSSV